MHVANRWTRWLLLGALVLVPLVPGRSIPDEPRSHPKPAIARVWHGRTPNAKADAYSKYLGDAITKFRKIPGNLGYQMMREMVGSETHFMVVSYWTSRDAIKAYAGEDIRKTRALPRDPEFLVDPEPTVMNYDVVVQDVGAPPEKS
ncbi:MAG TPA: antibiotic biosynthesis monooxygenase family protein [Anaeromyxobacteraceae bacterium]